MSTPEEFMRRALQLAERGLYVTSPNPRVGCVLVDAHEEIIGEGWTQPAGQNHAEIQALQDAQAKGHDVTCATAYVTLEPCSHFGRTPPCCDALVKAGIARVVAAMEDPNPLVSGRGFERLAAAGISVTSGLLADESEALNRGFVKRMRTGLPLVRVKIAASLDGRTALANGESKWITGEAARADGHHWRAQSCAVLTGIGTVLADDPQLNVRAVETTRQPAKVIVDARLQTPVDAAILREGKVFIATRVDEPERHAAYVAKGVEVIVLDGDADRIDLPSLMAELGKRQINEILVEAGARLNGAFIAAGCADELIVYLAPALLGDMARGMVALPEFSLLAERPQFRFDSVTKLGRDLRILARLN